MGGHTDLIQAIITVLAVMNPVGNAPIFSQIVQGLALKEQLWSAFRASFAILIILIISALIGKEVLRLFGISIDAFRIAGGLIISYMGFGMLSGTHSAVQHAAADKEEVMEKVLVPFAMPIVAGPGTITTIITLSVTHTPLGVPVTALVAAGVGAVVTYGTLIIVIKLGSKLSNRAQRIIMRFMGLILVSMGIQFMLTGIKSFMAAG